jgi:DNA-binding response OmpR family regulator
MQRILIVEDEQKTGRYLQQGLVEEGYQADLLIMAAMVLGPRRRDSMI